MSILTADAAALPGTPAAPAAHPQDLARGAAGVAVLHVERARTGTGPWHNAHTALAACTRHDLIIDAEAALYFGAPAVAFALHLAAGDTTRYARALDALDTRVADLARRRLHRAHQRIDRGDRPRLSEFDLFYGLTGLGVYLRLRRPDSETFRGVLSYLVRLTLPLRGDPDQLPGWWTPVGPSGIVSDDFPSGHGNAGMAHGIAGPLALLSLAQQRGITVPGQAEAIQRICAWLDALRQDVDTNPWWPTWITLAEHRAATVTHAGPPRPSWCYGIPGLARAQQLAGLALGDVTRQRMAEQALQRCLADPVQLGKIDDPGLCHGAAGLLITTHRVAQHAPDAFAAHLPRLRALVTAQAPAKHDGFLDGTTGPALAHLAADAGGATASGWDACLLLC